MLNDYLKFDYFRNVEIQFCKNTGTIFVNSDNVDTNV